MPPTPISSGRIEVKLFHVRGVVPHPEYVSSGQSPKRAFGNAAVMHCEGTVSVGEWDVEPILVYHLIVVTGTLVKSRPGVCQGACQLACEFACEFACRRPVSGMVPVVFRWTFDPDGVRRVIAELRLLNPARHALEFCAIAGSPHSGRN